MRMVEIFRGRIIDVSPKTYTIMITGDEAKLKAFLTLIKPLGIKELVRTGPIAMMRGEKTIKMKEIHIQRRRRRWLRCTTTKMPTSVY